MLSAWYLGKNMESKTCKYFEQPENKVVNNPDHVKLMKGQKIGVGQPHVADYSSKLRGFKKSIFPEI